MSLRQEFYCGECQGYFLATLNTAINDLQVKIVCPNCAHEHHRFIKDGQILENGRSGTPVQEILPMKCTYSKEPLTEVMREKHKAGGWNRRDGVPLPPMEEFAETYREEHFRERWLEKAANERDGGE